MHRPTEIESQLEHMPLFRGLGHRQLAQVGSSVTRLQIPVGRALTRQGAIGHDVVVVVDGEVEVTRDGQTIAVLGPGAHVGEVAIVENRPRNATVIARTPLVVDVIGEREFRALLATCPEVSERIAESVARRRAPELPASEPLVPEPVAG